MQFFRSLRNAIFLLILTALIFGGILFLVLSRNPIFSQTFRGDTSFYLKQSAKKFSSDIERMRKVITELESDPVVDSALVQGMLGGSKSEAIGELGKLIGNIKDAKKIMVVSPDGIVVASTDVKDVLKQKLSKQINDLLERNKTAKELIFPVKADENEIAILRKMFNDAGEPKGYLIVVFNYPKASYFKSVPAKSVKLIGRNVVINDYLISSRKDVNIENGKIKYISTTVEAAKKELKGLGFSIIYLNDKSSISISPVGWLALGISALLFIGSVVLVLLNLHNRDLSERMQETVSGIKEDLTGGWEGGEEHKETEEKQTEIPQEHAELMSMGQFEPQEDDLLEQQPASASETAESEISITEETTEAETISFAEETAEEETITFTERTIEETQETTEPETASLTEEETAEETPEIPPTEEASETITFTEEISETETITIPEETAEAPETPEPETSPIDETPETAESELISFTEETTLPLTEETPEAETPEVAPETEETEETFELPVETETAETPETAGGEVFSTEEAEIPTPDQEPVKEEIKTLAEEVINGKTEEGEEAEETSLEEIIVNEEPELLTASYEEIESEGEELEQLVSDVIGSEDEGKIDDVWLEVSKATAEICPDRKLLLLEKRDDAFYAKQTEGFSEATLTSFYIQESEPIYQKLLKFGKAIKINGKLSDVVEFQPRIPQQESEPLGTTLIIPVIIDGIIKGFMLAGFPSNCSIDLNQAKDIMKMCRV